LNNGDKVKVPDKIKIGPYEVKIEIVKNRALDRDHAGEYFTRELKIDLDESYKERHGEILMHEIIEAINDLYNLNIEHHDMMVLGVALYQMLKENKLTL